VLNKNAPSHEDWLNEKSKKEQRHEIISRHVSVKEKAIGKTTFTDRSRPAAKTPVHMKGERIEQEEHQHAWQRCCDETSAGYFHDGLTISSPMAAHRERLNGQPTPLGRHSVQRLVRRRFLRFE
jgi:hypothetical protein